MPGRIAKSILCFFVLFLFVVLPSFADIDAPHNTSRSIYCGSCHNSTAVLNSPFWDNDASPGRYNAICSKCHTGSGAPYVGDVGPAVATHSSVTTSNKYGSWSVLCIDCHDPHSHDQKRWSRSSSAELYLATGLFDSFRAGVPNANGPTSVFTYSTAVTYKDPWDATSITSKSSSQRRPILLPKYWVQSASFPVLDINEITGTSGEITVQGDVSEMYPNGFSYSSFVVLYGQSVKRYISVDFPGVTDGGGSPSPYTVNNAEVRFFDKQGYGSFAHDESGSGTDVNPNGICQVCHTVTNHWKNSGEMAAVGVHDGLNGSNCMDCHPHNEGFRPTYLDHGSKIDPVPFCQGCHTGSDVIRDVHGSNCSLCHDLPGYLPLGGRLPGDLGSYSLKLDCQDCHTQGHVASHDFAVINNPTCKRCHLDNVVDEHVTRRGFGCGVCHDNNNRSVVDTIAAGRAGSAVNCESCHHDTAVSPGGIGKFQEAHHATTYTSSGDCTYCHVVGPGTRGAAKMSCLLCHGVGELADPQRAGVEGHANGPALTNINDSRVCFSCHLANGAGYGVGVPLVTPIHALPSVPGFDFFEKYSFGPDLAYPGKDKINLLFPDMHSDGHSRPHQLGVTDKKHDPVQPKICNRLIPLRLVKHLV